MKKVALFAFGVAVCLAGCASSRGNLQTVSASQIGNNLLPDDITVTDIDRDMFETHWTATTPSGDTYSCSADDKVWHPYCAKTD